MSHGERGDRRRAGEQREDAELWADRRFWTPVCAGDELLDVECPEQRGSAFAKDEDEDGEHEHDGAPAAHLDGQLDDGLAER